MGGPGRITWGVVGLTLMTAIGAWTPSAHGEDARTSPPAEATALPEVDAPTVEVTPPENEWTLGHSHELRVVLRYDPSITVFFPGKPATPGFLLREVRDRREQGDKGVTIRTITLVLVPIRLDFLRLPVVDVAWKVEGSENQRGTVPVDLGRARVSGQFQGPDEAKLGPPPTGLTILQRNTALLVGAAALAAALAAILLTLLVAGFARRYLMGRKKPAPPADITALADLAKLEQNTELRSQPVRFFTKLSEVFRAYLGGRYAFEALEATSTELIKWVEQTKPAAMSSMTLGVLLESIDTVKFAGRPTGEQEDLAKLGEVRELVLRTRESPEERAARVAQLRALVPNKKERAMAFSVDLLCGGVLSLGLHLAGGFAKNWTLIAIGAGIMGLWLLFRDTFGRSPGKAAWSLRLVPAHITEDGQDISSSMVSTWSRISRNLLLLFWVLLPGEAIALALLPGERRLGDLWAGTRILREKEGGKASDIILVLALSIAALALVLIPPMWALMQLPGAVQ